jgi:hypothetical protein
MERIVRKRAALPDVAAATCLAGGRYQMAQALPGFHRIAKNATELT